MVVIHGVTTTSIVVFLVTYSLPSNVIFPDTFRVTFVITIHDIFFMLHCHLFRAFN